MAVRSPPESDSLSKLWSPDPNAANVDAIGCVPASLVETVFQAVFKTVLRPDRLS